MARLKKTIKRYRFFLLLLFINGLLFIIEPELGREAAALSAHNLLEMLSVIPPIFLLPGLMDVWVPRETMMKYMGADAGIRGGIFAVVLGSFSAGPLYAAFPVAAVFLKKGVSLTNVFLFIGAWSTTKIPMMLFEITQLGSKFALIRFSLNLEQFSKILRKVQQSGNRMAALSSLAGVSPPASSALPCNPRPYLLFSHYFRELL